MAGSVACYAIAMSLLVSGSKLRSPLSPPTGTTAAGSDLIAANATSEPLNFAGEVTKTVCPAATIADIRAATLAHLDPFNFLLGACVFVAVVTCQPLLAGCMPVFDGNELCAPRRLSAP